MVFRCQECGELTELYPKVEDRTVSVTETADAVVFRAKGALPRCPDCAAWAWELCGEGDEEDAV